MLFHLLFTFNNYFMPVIFNTQDAYVAGAPNDVTPIQDFPGVSIVGILHKNNNYNYYTFLPRGICHSQTIINYSCAEIIRIDGILNASIATIPNLRYFPFTPDRTWFPLIPNLQIVSNFPTTIFNENYIPYFIVAKGNWAQNIKVTVKIALEKLNIDILFRDKLVNVVPEKVDFTNVSDILVNVGGHAFGVPYFNPLIIPVP